MSAPLRSKTGCGRTWISISASPGGPPPMPGEPLPFRRSTCPASTPARDRHLDARAVGQRDRDLGAAGDVAEADLKAIADIAAAHPHGSPTGAAAEQFLDHVLEVGRVLERAGCRHSGRRRGPRRSRGRTARASSGAPLASISPRSNWRRFSSSDSSSLAAETSLNRSRPPCRRDADRDARSWRACDRQRGSGPRWRLGRRPEPRRDRAC